MDINFVCNFNFVALLNILIQLNHLVNSQSHYVNGFIHLSFEPKTLTLKPDVVSTLLVNITLRRPARSTFNPTAEEHHGAWAAHTVDVTACCVDPNIAKLVTSSNHELTTSIRLDEPKQHWLRMGVMGVGIGRTRVKFYVTKRCPAGGIVISSHGEECGTSWVGGGIPPPPPPNGPYPTVEEPVTVKSGKNSRVRMGRDVNGKKEDNISNLTLNSDFKSENKENIYNIIAGSDIKNDEKTGNIKQFNVFVVSNESERKMEDIVVTTSGISMEHDTEVTKQDAIEVGVTEANVHTKVEHKNTRENVANNNNRINAEHSNNKVSIDNYQDMNDVYAYMYNDFEAHDKENKDNNNVNIQNNNNKNQTTKSKHLPVSSLLNNMVDTLQNKKNKLEKNVSSNSSIENSQLATSMNSSENKENSTDDLYKLTNSKMLKSIFDLENSDVSSLTENDKNRTLDSSSSFTYSVDSEVKTAKDDKEILHNFQKSNHVVFQYGVQMSHVINSTFNDVIIETWWIAQSLEVRVLNPFDDPGNLEEDGEDFQLGRRSRGSYLVLGLEGLMLVMIGVNLVAIGGQLDKAEMVQLMRKPTALGVGVVARFVLAPAVCLLLVELFPHTSSTQTLGILGHTPCPSQGLPCLLVLLVEGDCSLSLLLTTVNNFASLGMLPLWCIIFEKTVYTEPGNLYIPFTDILFLLVFIILCSITGYIIRVRYPRYYFKFWLCLPLFTLSTVIGYLVTTLYVNHFLLSLATPTMLIQATLLAGMGFLIGALSSYLSRQKSSTNLCVACETGVHSTFIISRLLAGSFPQPEGSLARTLPVLTTTAALFPALFIGTAYRIGYKYRLSKYAETRCKMVVPNDSTGTQETSEVTICSTGDMGLKRSAVRQPRGSACRYEKDEVSELCAEDEQDMTSSRLALTSCA